MPHSIPTNRTGVLARVAGISLLSLLAAACAADSQRFAGIGGSDNMATGSLPPADIPGGGAPAPSYGGGSYGGSYGGSSAVSAAPLAPPAGAGQSSGHQSAGHQGAGFGSVRPDPMSGSANGWTAAGGASVSVGQGDTVQGLADRYGVPPGAIRAANNINGNGLTPGSSVVIPVYNPGASSVASAPAAVRGAAHQATAYPAARPAGLAATTARPGAAMAPTRTAVSEAPGKAVRQAQQDVHAKAGSAERTAKVIAASRAAVQQPVKAGQPPQSLQQQAQAIAKPAAQAQQPKVAAAKAQVQAQAPAIPEPKAPERQQVAVAAPEAAVAKEQSSGGSFRWPARGRIIAGFNGRSGNEGINIAVPEGTPVKAAEGGVVAYAGSELKGYGNLVLIRHENGWVSAYANNGELMVKRGEKVARGQTVAKSGQSGNVSTPQLHFELRKGSTPVDPMPHLAGG